MPQTPPPAADGLPPLRVYSIPQAAAVLAPIVTKDWLSKHLDEIPHLRTGRGRGRSGRIGFTDAHLAEILRQLEQTPTASPAPAPAGPITRRRSA